MTKQRERRTQTLIVVILVIVALVLLEQLRPETTSGQGSPDGSRANQALSIPPVGELGNADGETGGDPRYQLAPDFQGITAWINSEPLSIKDLRGNVVLVDIWTYSCINCIRTLPYVTGWDEKYRDDGLIVVGVHSPEFWFEKEEANVRSAILENGIEYPVAMDNDKLTWRAYQNRYWPRKYLIDIHGRIRYDHIGEGGYEETEKFIQQLLRERAEAMNETADVEEDVLAPVLAVDVDFRSIQTPEIYFGHEFIRGNFGSAEGVTPGAVTSYAEPERIDANSVYLVGDWKAEGEYMELASGEGSVILYYGAKVANIVAGADKGANVTVFLDKTTETNGSPNGDVQIDTFKLYNVVDMPEYGEHLLRLEIKGEGFKIYTFTFG